MARMATTRPHSPVNPPPAGASGLARRDLLKAAGLAAGACLLRTPHPARAQAAPRGQAAQPGLLGPRPSPWFTPLDDREIRCDLCPKACRIAPGRRGACRVRENRNGTAYTLVYGNPVIVQTDPIERKPFYHVRPASRSLSVATAGCNFACKFCEVWDLALVAPEDVHAYDVPPADVIRHARAADAQSVAFTFGEPITCFEYALDTFREARAAGLLTLLHTNGSLQPEPLRELSGVLDAAQIDLKGFDPAFYRDVCGGELEPVLATLRHLRAAGVHIEITTVLIPTLNDHDDTLRRLCRWVRDELGPGTPLHFSRFYPLYQLANLPPTPMTTLDRARDAALDEGLQHVYIANVPGHDGQHTRCPACGHRLIERIGFFVEFNHLDAGRCPRCAHAVPGLWDA